MERLAEYLAVELAEATGEITQIQTYKAMLSSALSKLDKQDLLKMLDVKECQCETEK